MYTVFCVLKWNQAIASLWYCPGCFYSIFARTLEVRTSFTQIIWSNSLSFAFFGFIVWLSTLVYFIYGYKPFQHYLVLFLDISIMARILLVLCQSSYYSDLLYVFEKAFAFQWSAADSKDHVASFIQSDGAFAQAIAQAIDLHLNLRICIVAQTINVFCGGKFPASAQLTRYFGFISDAYPKQTEGMTLDMVVDACKKAKKQSVLVEQLLKFSPWFIGVILELFNVQVKGRASQGLTLPEQSMLQKRLFPLFDAANTAVGRLSSGFVLSGNELASRYKKHKAEKAANLPKVSGTKTRKTKKVLLVV